MGYIIRPEHLSQEAKDKMREQAISAALIRVVAERNYKEAPGWKTYQYVPFEEAPEVVKAQYLRKAEEELKHSTGNSGG